MQLKLECHWVLANKFAKQQHPYIFALLTAISRTGSLSKAAPIIGLSYRHVWNLIRKWTQMLEQPLVILERGRGARLTPFGEKLLWADQRVEARLRPQLENLTAELEQELSRTYAIEHAALRMYASHDLALVELRDMLNQNPKARRLDLQFRGSLDCLALLARSQCDIAGFHVPQLANNRNLLLRYRRWLKPRSEILIEFVTRRQGLMVPSGNPKRIRRVHDLTRNNVRFVSRQQGSGTRMLLDLLLLQAGLEQGKIQGIQHEEFTHAAVAATVAGGKADAGMGIEAAANQYGLDFVPIANERYFLVTHQDRLRQPAFKALRAAIQSSAFRKKVARLPGYDASRAGEIVSIKRIFP